MCTAFNLWSCLLLKLGLTCIQLNFYIESGFFMFIAFINACESILTIVIMFMTGWLLTHVGWFNNKTGETFTKIILNVSLPCYMLWNITSNFGKSMLFELGSGLIVPFLSIGLNYLFGILVSNLLKVEKGRKGIFRSVFFASNSVLIGFAVNLALFGEQSTPYVLMYYFANTTFIWTVGNYEISKDGQNSEPCPFFTISNLKRIASPALSGFVVALILILTNVTLPKFVMDSARYIGQLTTPLGMFFIGIVLHSIRIRDIRFDRNIIALLIARFLISPMTILLIEQFIHLPPMMAKVFVIQAAMPAFSSTGMIAKRYGADYEFGTLIIVITAIFSMIVIPFYTAIL